MKKKQIDFTRFKIGNTINFSSRVPLLINRWGRIENIFDSYLEITEITDMRGTKSVEKYYKENHIIAKQDFTELRCADVKGFND